LDSVWSQIFYHVWWPGQGNDPMYLINQQMNRDRNDYYGNNYTPHLYSNGRDSGTSPATWRDDARNITNEISLFTMNSTSTKEGRDITVSVYAKSLIDTSPNAELKLFVAVVLDKVVYPNSPNGLTDHYDVVVDLLSGNRGKKVIFEANIPKVETFSWTFPDPWINKSIASWNSNELKVVSWIQDYSSKQILQVSKEVLE
tara:strand:+ start:319 stop:918 length:600 start_codon:yes stop_codon:yes gene_type:complete